MFVNGQSNIFSNAFFSGDLINQALKLTNTESPKDFWQCLRSADVVSRNKCNPIITQIDINNINILFEQMGSGCEVDRSEVFFSPK